MLLRSSSTPILSTLPPFAQSEGPPPEQAKHESLLSSETAKSLSFSSSSSRSLTSPSTQSTAGSEVFAGDEKQWDADGESALRQARVRRAQSENDLQRLGLGSFAPAKIAAKCFLSNDELNGVLIAEDRRDIARKSIPKLPNRRWARSFSSPHSVCLGTTGLDREDFIPEEEVYSKIYSEDLDESSFSFNQSHLVCKERVTLADHEVKTDSPATGRVLEVRNSEVSVKERVLCVPECDRSDRTVSSTRSLDGDEKAVFAGRIDSSQVSYGDNNSSAKIGLDRAVAAVCNSQEYSSFFGGEQSKLPRYGEGIEVGGSMSGGGGGPLVTTSSGGGSGAEADMTDLYYRKMLAENPGQPLLLRNYSQFLAEVKHDYSKAEEYCARAILANPSDGEILAQYAKIIWDVYRDAGRAEEYFERAVQAAPDDSYVMAAYASFLWNSEEEEQEQQEVIKSHEQSGTLLPSCPNLVSAGPA